MKSVWDSTDYDVYGDWLRLHYHLMQVYHHVGRVNWNADFMKLKDAGASHYWTRHKGHFLWNTNLRALISLRRLHWCFQTPAISQMEINSSWHRSGSGIPKEIDFTPKKGINFKYNIVKSHYLYRLE